MERREKELEEMRADCKVKEAGPYKTHCFTNFGKL